MSLLDSIDLDTRPGVYGASPTGTGVGRTGAAAGSPAASSAGGLLAMLGTPKLAASSSAGGFGAAAVAGGASAAPTIKLTSAEIAELREIFNLVDKDGGGTISKNELADLMATLGIRATADELDLMVREVDTDASGDISFQEFIYVMQRRVNVPYTADEVKAAFRVFENGAPPGYIRVPDLIKALATYSSEKLGEEKLSELVAQLEPDSNGMINYVDFVNMMMA